LFYIINRWLKRKREQKLAREIAGVQTAALEQQAFTSLMNPHFLFNALNSIQHYINVQDRKNANRYLSDFASLIRKNFEAAQKSFIPLEQEMENIKIYLRLEQMRFNDRFSYEVNVAENVGLEDWMIPTMMLQPFLENALLHGIMPSAIEGIVMVDVTEDHGNLLITITDNGIGFANSMAFKEDGAHKSLGMELIQKRIAALSRFGITSISINISPAFENENNPGNKIMLLIPAGLYKAWLQAQH
jgi:LytS/YehU family sensor histidine kinase